MMAGSDCPAYVFVRNGRRPATLIFSAIGIAFLALAIIQRAPLPVFVPVILFLAGSLYLVLANPVSGTRLDRQSWHFRGEGFDREIAIADISRVLIKADSDGPDLVTVHLRDGQSMEVPDLCLPGGKVLEVQLRRAGIAVSRG